MLHDPDTWTTPHLLQLKREYDILLDKYGYVVQETFTVQDPPASPSDTLLLPPLKYHYKTNEHIHERPQPGDSRPVLSPSHHTSLESEKTRTHPADDFVQLFDPFVPDFRGIRQTNHRHYILFNSFALRPMPSK